MHQKTRDPLSALNVWQWQHREFERRVTRYNKEHSETPIHNSYDILFALRERLDSPEYWFRVIEWSGYRLYLPNCNELNLLREREATYEVIELMSASISELAEFVAEFLK